MRILAICFLLISFLSCNGKQEIKKDFYTIFEKSEGLKTPTYKEVISYYKSLAQTYPEISLHHFGKTDLGERLHIVVFNSSTDIIQLKNSSKNRKVS